MNYDRSTVEPALWTPAYYGQLSVPTKSSYFSYSLSPSY